MGDQKTEPNLLEEWLNLRERTNHDWIRNRFLVQLRSRPEWLAGQPLEREQILASWRAKREVLTTIIEQAYVALSPGIWPEWAKMPGSEAFRDRFQKAYEESGEIPEKQKRLRQLLADIDCLVELLAKQEITTAEISELADAVLTLSRALSDLPHGPVFLRSR